MLPSGTIFMSLVMHFGVPIKKRTARRHTTIKNSTRAVVNSGLLYFLTWLKLLSKFVCYL